MWTILIPFFLAEGLYFSVCTGFFQITQIKLWMKKTIAAIFFDPDIRKNKNKSEISRFQSFCAVMAGCAGTGNLAGVATAITAGGPGAVFWMWVAALFGMMLTYAENLLGIKYRFRDEEGNWHGGPMAYIDRGCKKHKMAVLFSSVCLAGSLGMGNMTQVNSMACSLKETFHIPPHVTGIVCLCVIAVILAGGSGRVIQTVEKIVPIMSLIFIAGALTAIGVHIGKLPEAIREIFTEAFSFRAGSAGVVGYGIKKAMHFGIARGVFTNEAGLGSSVLANQSSDIKEPCEQGMWAIFAVFLDTIVMCSLTAFTILTSGVYQTQQYGLIRNTSKFLEVPDGAVLTSKAFAVSFGEKGEIFIAVCMVLFAVSSLLAWSYYGSLAANYLTGKRKAYMYQAIFLICIYIGSVVELTMIWNISDMANAVMAAVNLAALWMLSKEVIQETRQYVDERAKKVYNRQ